MTQVGALILGTAGHTDHGKTALIRALTGRETDRLPAEQERGISIELGFAHYEIEGTRFGVIDVPGHERFVRHMLAGAHGMDLALIVVAADDGIRPQTEEHFDILHLLGARRAIFVITKIDLAPERAAGLKDDLEALASGTRFESAPVLAVSSVTGEGLAELRSEIARRLRELPPRSARGYFRLPVDRAFGLDGHGLVVTGTASAGRVRVGDALVIRPGSLETRARSLQIHGETVAEARAGQRLAVNLAGLSVEQVRRGQWLVDPRVEIETDRFDAWLEARGGLRQPLRSFDRVRVHIAATEVMGRAILLHERKDLGSQESGFAQIALDEPALVCAGDRFVLRTEATSRTAGGGRVLHPFAPRHPTGDAGLEKRLTSLRDGDLGTRLVAFLDLLHEFAASTELAAQALGETSAELVAAARGSAVVALPDDARPEAWTTESRWRALGELVVEVLGHFHRTHPLEPGMDLESLRSRLRAPLPPQLFRPVIERLASDRRVVLEETKGRLPGHRVDLGENAADLAGRVRRALRAGRATPPDRRQLEASLGVTPPQIAEVLRVLEQRGEVVRVSPDLFYDLESLGEIREGLRSFLRDRPEITVAEFRDLIAASRKYALALLEHFDRTALTLRVGDARKLRASS